MDQNYKISTMFGKSLLIGIVICVTAGAVLFFIKTDISAYEDVKLEKPSMYVLEEIIDLRKFQEWDPRAVKDSAIIVEYFGEPGVGMRAVTKGKGGVFINEYEILNIKPLESVQIVLRLTGGNDLIYDFEIVDLQQGSELTWKVNFRAPLFVAVVGVEDQIKQEFRNGFEVLKKRLQ